MGEFTTVSAGKMGSGKGGKVASPGFLGMSLACLGCCLAPILVTAAFAGIVGASEATNGIAIPSCKLAPAAQAARIKELRSDLFSEIESVIEEEGMLGFRFKDNPKNVAMLTPVIIRPCRPFKRPGFPWGGRVFLFPLL
jgi:hypothetical protein